MHKTEERKRVRERLGDIYKKKYGKNQEEEGRRNIVKKNIARSFNHSPKLSFDEKFY